MFSLYFYDRACESDRTRCVKPFRCPEDYVVIFNAYFTPMVLGTSGECIPYPRNRSRFTAYPRIRFVYEKKTSITFRLDGNTFALCHSWMYKCGNQGLSKPTRMRRMCPKPP